MAALIEYLLQITALWGLGLAWFAYFLRKQGRLAANRIFLLLFLLIVPLLLALLPLFETDNTVYFHQFGTVVVQKTAENIAAPLATTSGLWLSLFLLGITWASLRFLWATGRLLSLFRKTDREDFEGQQLLRLANSSDCYAFFGYIVVGDQITAEELPFIVAHERAHSQMKHSWDNLATEIVAIFFWFHPFVFIYRYFLRELHEFQADSEVIRRFPTYQYAQLLLQRAMQANFTVLHHFSQASQLKNRLIMMNKIKNYRLNALAYWAALPLFLISFVFLTAAPMQAQDKTQENVEVAPIFGECKGLSAEETATCSTSNVMQLLSANLKYPKQALEQKTEGKVFVQFTVAATGDLKDLKIMRSLSPECDAEALRVVALLQNWQAGTKAGKAVDVVMVLPIAFQLAK